MTPRIHSVEQMTSIMYQHADVDPRTRRNCFIVNALCMVQQTQPNNCYTASDVSDRRSLLLGKALLDYTENISNN